MSKRKVATKRSPTSHRSATTAKRARRPKVAARAQHKKQAVIRSRKERTSSAAAAGSPEAPAAAAGSPEALRKIYDQPKVEAAAIIDNRARAAALESILQTSLQHAAGPKTNDNVPGRGGFFLQFADMQAYQSRLWEVTQANAQFAFEFGLRVAQIRSPLEFWGVVVEFTGRRFIMIMKDSKELAAFWRTEAARDLTALPGR